MTQRLSYCPTDPAAVSDVTRIRLFGAPPPYAEQVAVADVAPIGQGDCYVAEVSDDLVGTFYAEVTLVYADAQPGDDPSLDTDDIVILGASSGATGRHFAPQWPWDPVCTPDLEGLTGDQAVMLERLKDIGRDVLWRASGRRFGVVRETVRPLAPSCQVSTYAHSGVVAGVLRPVLDGGVWRNCGSCRSCLSGGRQVRLLAPVQTVEQVVIDGALFAAAGYRVDDQQWLIRLDGDPWPDQQLYLPNGDPGTWSVTYTFGVPLSAAGVYAYGMYVAELYKLCSGARCRLPAKVEGIFRQGVNVDFADDNLDLLSRGRTGIPEVDSWLAVVNPYGIHESSRVYSPDVPRGRSVWPA